jgi:hypothetical protein
VVLACVTASPAAAQLSDKRTFFTFSGPVEVPGVALPPGKYLFRVVDPGGRVVQVLSADGKTPYGMFFSLPAERLTPAPGPEVRFMETPRGTPPAIRTWWYPGETIGREFIYPKEQAQRLAKNVSEPILTTQRATKMAEETDTSQLSRVASSGAETSVNAGSKPAASAPSGSSQPGEPAPASIAIQPAGTAAAATSSTAGGQTVATSGSPAKRSRKHLPQTGSAVPLAGLIALYLITMATWIHLWRTRHR